MDGRGGKSVVVVGAGIVGAATAYFLSRRGYKVRLIEAVAPAAAASGSADGAVSVASKRPGPMMTTALAGIALYRQLEREGLFSGLFKQRPTVMVAEDESEVESLVGHADALAGEGMSLRRIEGEALRRYLPDVSPGVRLAIEVGNEGHAIGYEIVRRLIAASGVAVERDTRVLGLVDSGSGGSIAAVDTSRGRAEAEHFVIAAGGGSADLIGLPGIVRPRKGQLVVTERAPMLATTLPGALMSCRYLLSKDAIQGGGTAARRFGLVVDPLRTGQFLIGGTREETADTGNDLAAIRHLLASAVRLLPPLERLRVIRVFAGVRSATIDGLPVIGRMAGYDNLVVATGFEGDGICLGPLVGQAVSRIVAGEPGELDLRPFSPDRFAQRSLVA
ncbi:FAD-binding oxidoreductase [Aquibium carbonis]|uniref:FAD-binding oxidoreductase n=1 Tax=Aquibium carbonis TaxID=2495581 RepID=A0A3R9YBX5_9HYPH|nr:FAD-binding oxidoreductase [Aquibium carbonis]RST87774.1 FAD-binding oxidoreductase [Aquibium carbonis]